MGKNEIGPLLSTSHTQKSVTASLQTQMWKAKTIKVFSLDNIEEYLLVMENFPKQNTESAKRKNWKMELYFHVTDTMKKVKRNATKWKEIFAIHVTYKGPISTILKMQTKTLTKQ